MTQVALTKEGHDAVFAQTGTSRMAAGGEVTNEPSANDTARTPVRLTRQANRSDWAASSITASPSSRGQSFPARVAEQQTHHDAKILGRSNRAYSPGSRGFGRQTRCRPADLRFGMWLGPLYASLAAITNLPRFSFPQRAIMLASPTMTWSVWRSPKSRMCCIRPCRSGPFLALVCSDRSPATKSSTERT